MDIINSVNSTTDNPDDMYTHFDNILSDGYHYVHHNDYGTKYCDHTEFDINKDSHEFLQTYRLFNIDSGQEGISILDPVMFMRTTGHIKDFSHDGGTVNVSLDNVQLNLKFDLDKLSSFHQEVNLEPTYSSNTQPEPIIDPSQTKELNK